MKKILLLACLCIAAMPLQAAVQVLTCDMFRAQWDSFPSNTPSEAKLVQFQKRLPPSGPYSQIGFLWESVVHLCGLGVAQDVDKGLQLIVRSSEAGNGAADLILAAMYELGTLGVTKSSEQSLLWTMKASEKNEPVAQLAIGLRYLTGTEVPRDDIAGERLLLKAAASGFPDAIDALSGFYVMATRYVDALRWLHIGAANKQGVSYGWLAFMYGNGHGVTRDTAEAFRWVTLAAEQKLPGSQYQLGRLYANGDGVKSDVLAAAKWYRMAADQGYADAQAAMATCYEFGLGVSANEVESLRWRKMAAKSGSTAAQLRLMAAADQLPKEEGTLRVSASTGIASAQFNLALHLAQKNDSEAERWFRLSADQGNLGAMYELGVAYFDGRFGKKDAGQALLLVRGAAAKGHRASIRWLASAFYTGALVPRSLVTAYALEYVAGAPEETFDKQLEFFRPSYYAEMTKAEVVRAQQLARDLVVPNSLLIALDAYAPQ